MVKKNNINDIIINYDNYDIDKIICDQESYTKNKYQYSSLYRSDCANPLQKIWLKLPKMRVYYVIKKANEPVAIKLIFSDNKETESIIKFITDFEKKANELLNPSYKVRKNILSCDGFPASMIINLPYDNKNDKIPIHKLKIFDKKNNRIGIESITKNSCVSSYIELSHSWMNNKEIGFNWNFLQIKLYHQYEDFDYCLFSDAEEDVQPNQSSTTYYIQEFNQTIPQAQAQVQIQAQVHPHNIPPPPVNINRPPPPPPPPPRMSFVPTADDLKLKLNSLRKINSNNENSPQSPKPSNPNPITDTKSKPKKKKIKDHKTKKDKEKNKEESKQKCIGLDE